MKRHLVTWLFACVAGITVPAVAQQKAPGSGDVRIPSTPETVIRGHIPAYLPPIMRVKPGQTVTIDTLSHQGINTGDDPIAFFARGGIPREQVLPWNFGQGSLQPLLLEMASEHADVMEQIFGTQLRALKEALDASHEDLMNFARSVQHPVKHTVFEPWRGYARALGRTPEFQRIQVKHANGNFQQALSLCREYDLWSERAVALMFDIVTQNGSIRKITRAQILADIQALRREQRSPRRTAYSHEPIHTDPALRDDPAEFFQIGKL